MSVSNLRKASFRGIEFGVTSNEFTGGRRTVEHVFPGKDDSFIEDLGRKARKFSVEAFVVGDDYQGKRNALINAIELGGTGTLVHPYYGELTVKVAGDFTVKEQWDEGRVARITIPFAQSSPANYPVTTKNSVSNTTAKADALVAGSGAFADKKLVVSKPFTVSGLLQSISAAIEGITDVLNQGVKSTMAGADQITRDIARLSADLSVLIATPGTIVLRFAEILRRLTVVADPLTAVHVYQRIYAMAPGYFSAIYQDTVNGRQASANDAAMLISIRSVVAGSAAEAASQATYDTRRQAYDTRDAVMAMFSQIMESTTDDDMFVSCSDARLAVADAVPPDGQRLRDLRSEVMIDSMPVIVMSHRLYGNTDMEVDIIGRNGIRHPGAIPGGSTIEVLSS